MGATFTGEINLSNSDQQYQLTVFPETLNTYFNKCDIIGEFFSKPEELEMMILNLTNVDVTFSSSKKVIIVLLIMKSLTIRFY